MTERGRDAVTRSADSLTIGPSSLRWDGDTLVIDIDEIGAPLPKRIRGTIRVTPQALPGRQFALDAGTKHLWQPIAPTARIEVDLNTPSLRWNGTGYLDSNRGSEPLEAGFQNWSWSRAHRKKDCVVLYDATRRDGSDSTMALRFAQDGAVEELPPLPPAYLKRTGWRIARPTRADTGHAVTLVETLEDTPFYARSRLKTQLYGETGDIFHESLDLDRFASPIVRAMLPFRMPRRLF